MNLLRIFPLTRGGENLEQNAINFLKYDEE